MSSRKLKHVSVISHESQQIKSAEVIIFTKEFNGFISNIPEGVKAVDIGNADPYTLLHLPKSLKVLYIRCNIEKVTLPDSLLYLKLGKSFVGSITRWPKSLKSLSIYDADISSLPDSIEYLNLNSSCIYKRINRLPKSLKTLVVTPCFGKNGESLWLKELHRLEHFEYKTEYSDETYNSIVKDLPPNLKILKGLQESSASSNTIQGQFPDSLEYFEGDFISYKGPLPKSLKVFKCPSYSIRSPLPESLEYLEVSSIEGEGASTLSRLTKLKSLILVSCLEEIELPLSLEYLEIKSSGIITKLPDSLRVLIVPRSVFKDIIRLPESIEILEII